MKQLNYMTFSYRSCHTDSSCVRVGLSLRSVNVTFITFRIYFFDRKYRYSILISITMTVEEESHYSDTTEPSNATSLPSDTSCIINPCQLGRTGAAAVDTNNDCNCQVDQHSPKFPESPPIFTMQSKPIQPSCQIPPTYQSHVPPCQPGKQCEPGVTCVCHTYNQNTCGTPMKYSKRSGERLEPAWKGINWKCPGQEYPRILDDNAYRIKLKRNHRSYYPEACVYREVSEGIPNLKSINTEKLGDRKCQSGCEPEISERIDIYYFDHGNSAYYRTTDSPPILATEKCAERTDFIATRFWAEIFGTVHIGIAFVTAFILQLLRFVLFSIIRPLTVGILQLLADYFIKPFLSILFNALIQPILILLYNVATSFRDLCEPLAEAFGFFLREVANVFKSLRIVEVNNTRSTVNGGNT
ncbi:uncharacterized protein LOC107263849 isoform X2 [Cephus cinctus]|uniref:Uncharacterized protein LOC107263849 isoform X2 n=1 Tax=Cephus cinctus TaxID=211228 RepID=A0AAJ7R9S5_CEPCN|nr:uncharacterized protein LOC107263849 isoform X2 [Cephus cinctus]